MGTLHITELGRLFFMKQHFEPLEEGILVQRVAVSCVLARIFTPSRRERAKQEENDTRDTETYKVTPETSY